ncbi:MAG: GAF domain-containing protein, partial [Hyphomicrobiales bacterium]|nr:GAF domain-containing protein [Hyphomicrobiales bacterium]
MPVLGTGATERSDQTFIRAIEIWVPCKNRRRLELGAGLYGPLSEFETASHAISFGFDEGLPGKAWAAGHPIVLKNLTGSYFKRGEVAQAAGLTCGVALPIFAGSFLLAVIVLFCGDDRNHVGAIELWHTPLGSNE